MTIEETIEYLNELNRLDPKAMLALVRFRWYGITKGLADHPSCQVVGSGRNASVGFIGILNGMFGMRDDGWGGISMVVDTAEDDPERITKLVRFEKTRRLMDA